MFLAQPPEFHLWIPGAPFSPHGRGRAKRRCNQSKMHLGATFTAALAFQPSSGFVPAAGPLARQQSECRCRCGKIVASLCFGKRDQSGESGFKLQTEQLLVRNVTSVICDGIERLLIQQFHQHNSWKNVCTPSFNPRLQVFTLKLKVCKTITQSSSTLLPLKAQQLLSLLTVIIIL